MGINAFYEFNGNKRNIFCQNLDSNLDLYNEVSKTENLPLDLFKIYLNNKCLAKDQTSLDCHNNDLFLTLSIPLLGGKGGFGSMLRAIGAQIEKTTNKEACRDLSGRRLRDVNAEKRIKNWLTKKSEKKKEQERKKKEKLERLTQEPKIDFRDEYYLEQKDKIPQKVDDAIDYILKKKNKKASKTSTVTSEVKSSVTSTAASGVASSVTSTVTESNVESTKTNEEIKPSTSSSSSDNCELSAQKNLDSQGSSTDSNSSTSNKNEINQSAKRKLNDEPIVSKKKKVQLWLGDDLDDSEDSD